MANSLLGQKSDPAMDDGHDSTKLYWPNGKPLLDKMTWKQPMSYWLFANTD